MARRAFGEPHRFSHYFNVDADELDAVGAFDITLETDENLLIDPKLLDASAVEEMEGAYEAIHAHFGDVLLLLRKSKKEGDTLWRNALSKFDFPEFRAAGLGYSKNSTRGRGWSLDDRIRTLKTASEIVEAGLDDPRIFELSGLLENGIGADHISDMLGNLLADRLAAFTARVCVELEVPLEDQRLANKHYDLPAFIDDEGKKRPVVLVPEDILSRIPLAMDNSEVADVVNQNQELRQYINEKIGSGWLRTAQKSKRDARRIFRRPDVLRGTLEEYSAAEGNRYDYTRDEQRQLRITASAHRALDPHPLRLYLEDRPSREDVYAAVGEIIKDFKQHVENGRLRELLFIGDRVRPENYFQAALQTVAAIHCRYNDLDLSPESNLGRGAVDFKFSRGSTRKIVVECKLSEHKQLVKGYNNQLKAYREAERTPYSYYVVLDDGKHELAIERLIAASTSAQKTMDDAPGLIVIDGRKKPSASKI